MRRTRRRRPRVAWFPTFGGAPIVEGGAPFAGVQTTLELGTEPGGQGDIVFDAVPLTFDVSFGAGDTQGDPSNRSLRDIIQGNEWRFRRLVGKAFISATTQTTGTLAQTLVDVALGFIVCKTYDDGFPWTDFSEVNPLSQESMEDPWIWRRRWLLNPHGNVSFTAPVTNDIRNLAGYWGYPQTTTQYGSIQDGPHIDAKSNRIIHRSERLYAVLAARRYAPQVGTAVEMVPAEINMLLDYRILGSLKGSTYGNRGNMSR